MDPFILADDRLRLEEKFLCLDFVNTVDNHASTQPEENLNSYAELIAWFRNIGLIDAQDEIRLGELGERDPRAGRSYLTSARELREALFRIFSAQVFGEPVAQADLEVLNRYLEAAFRHLRLAPRGTGFDWEWIDEERGVEALLGRIASSAAGLLTSKELARVGRCADDRGCGWLFFDTSKNHSRRWCDMESCGNRAKANRHYHQKPAVA